MNVSNYFFLTKQLFRPRLVVVTNNLSTSSKFQCNTLPNNTIELSFDTNDEYKSDRALIIAHGLFASKGSWRSIARRINEKTKHKVTVFLALIYYSFNINYLI
jgi:hypothetical protein